MKVNMFIDTTSYRRTGKSGGYTGTQLYYRVSEGRVAGGGDSIDISVEARKRYETVKIIELDRVRTKKLAEEYMPLLMKKVFHAEGGSDIDGKTGIQSAVKSGTYNFDAADVIHKTVDNLMPLFA